MGNVTQKGETTLVLTNCVLSYPHLFEARAAAPGSDPKFSAGLILPELTQEDQAVFQAVFAHVTAQKWPQGAPANLKYPWKVVDEKTPEYLGRSWFNAGAAVDRQPVAVLEDAKTRAQAADIFPGMGVNAYVGVFAYDLPTNKGIGFGLNAIQIADRTLPRLDGRLMPEDVFTPVAAPAAAVPPGAPGAVPAAPVMPGMPGAPNPLS